MVRGRGGEGREGKGRVDERDAFENCLFGLH